MANFLQTYPNVNIPKYTNLAAFPSAASQGNGSYAVALDTDILYVSDGTAWLLAANPASSGGTVTSVGFTEGSTVPIFTITGSPVTGSGTLTETLKTQTANTIFAGPTTGIAAQPGFRALVVADIPTGNLTDVGTDGIVITGGTGAVIGSGTSIAQHVADSTHNGYLSSTDWSIFNNKQASLTLGNLSDAGADGIVVTGGTGAVIGSGTSIAQQVADASHNGYLSSTDWTTFNSKGSGSVSSVAAMVPAFMSIAGSPVTTTGTLAFGLSGTALPIANGGTGITSFGTGVATFLGTPSSANLAAALTDETGSGLAVFNNTPTLITPVLGIPTSGTLSNCTTVKGIITGSAIASGIIGQVLTSGSLGAAINVAGNTLTELGNLVIPAGNFNVFLFVCYNGAVANGYMTAYLNTASASASGNVLGLDYGITPIITATGAGGTISFMVPIDTTGATYYLNVYIPTASAGTGGILGSLKAVRR